MSDELQALCLHDDGDRDEEFVVRAGRSLRTLVGSWSP